MSSAIFPWIGGKRRLAKHILPLVNNGHQCYIEPFAGGASIFFMKEPSKVEVINDINGDVANLYRVVRNHLDELLRHFRWALISREDFITQRSIDPSTLTDIQRAARFYYLQKMAFGGKVQGQSFGTATTTPPKLNLLRIEEDLSAAHIRLARTYIENLSWEKCVEKYDRDNSLFYLDPPYWGTEGYGVEFPLENYSRMAELATTCKGRFVISVNDIPEMHQALKDLNIQSVPIRYTVGGRGGVQRRELIITN